MNVLNQAIKGAASQFGREFGRAGANAILNGKNHYVIKGKSDYGGRIKPSDSKVIKSIKTIDKLKFVSTNKANIVRLIEATDLMIDIMQFKGLETLNQISDINYLVDKYNDKFEVGEAMIDNDYKSDVTKLLEKKQNQLLENVNIFNSSLKSYVQTNLENAKKKKRDKKIATFLSFPFPLGGFGFHQFYLKNYGYGFLYLIFSLSLIPAILSLVTFIKIIGMNQKQFDAKYNPVYSYFSQFSLKK